MKKFSVAFTLLTLALGAAGAVLHKFQMLTAIEPQTGLSITNAPISIFTAAFSLLASVLFILLVQLLKNKNVEPVYHEAMAPGKGNIIPMIVSAAMILVAALGAYKCYTLGIGVRCTEIAVLILALMAVLAGVAFFVMSLFAYLRRSGAETMLCAVVIILFVCYWLVLAYKENSADPVRIKFVYEFLGLCAAALAVYYTAGYAFGSSRPRMTVAVSAIAVYFCAMSIPTASCAAFRYFYIFALMQICLSMFLLLWNLKPAEKIKADEEAEREEKEEASEEDEEEYGEEPEGEEIPE
jgi:hypothetical protein